MDHSQEEDDSDEKSRLKPGKDTGKSDPLDGEEKPLSDTNKQNDNTNCTEDEVHLEVFNLSIDPENHFPPLLTPYSHPLDFEESSNNMHTEEWQSPLLDSCTFSEQNSQPDPCVSDVHTEGARNSQPDPCVSDVHTEGVRNSQPDPCVSDVHTEGARNSQQDPCVSDVHTEGALSCQSDPCVSDVHTEGARNSQQDPCVSDVHTEGARNSQPDPCVSDVHTEGARNSQPDPCVSDVHTEGARNSQPDPCVSDVHTEGARNSQPDPCVSDVHTEGARNSQPDPCVSDVHTEGVRNSQPDPCVSDVHTEGARNSQPDPCVSDVHTEGARNSQPDPCVSDVHTEGARNSQPDPCVSDVHTEGVRNSQPDPCVSDVHTEGVRNSQPDPCVSDVHTEGARNSQPDPCKEVSQITKELLNLSSTPPVDGKVALSATDTAHLLPLQSRFNTSQDSGLAQHSTMLSKASLNQPNTNQLLQDRTALSDSEGHRPRQRVRSLSSTRARSAAKVTWSSEDIHQDLASFRAQVQQPRDLAMNIDGRHALNYGPETALDDMLSDIRRLSQESESEQDEEEEETARSTPNIGINVSPRQQVRRRTARRPAKKTGRRHKRRRKHELEREETEEVIEVPSLLKCPVCLDIFYIAHTIKPCGHIFCEPCLRHLAKCNRDSMRPTTCPVCRQPITDCVRNEELTDLVQFYHVEDFRRRHRVERDNKYMRHPLPSTYPDVFSPKHQLSRIVSRLDRNRLARRRTRIGAAPIRVNFWRFISLALAFILFKGLLLMVILCLYCIFYDQALHEKLFDSSVMALSAFRYLAMATPKLWGIAGFFLFGVIIAFVIRSGHAGVWLKPLQ